MLIYVAGPIRPVGEQTLEGNLQNAKNIALQLWLKGYAVICPHANGDLPFSLAEKSAEPEVWLNGDLEMLARCDAMVVCPGWETSEGTLGEIAYAEVRKIPVSYWPDIPTAYSAEVSSPNQCKAFIDTVMSMYRVHLSKNSDYCLAPEGVRVLTENLEWIPLSDVKVGMTLLGFDEDAVALGHSRRMYRPSVVEAVSEVELPSYRLWLSDGTQFVTSENHPWLVSSGLTGRWLTTDRLRDFNKGLPAFSRFIKPLDMWETDTSYDAGYLAAALDGEGWLSQQHPTGINKNKAGMTFALGFAQNNNAMFDYMRASLDSRGIPYRVRTNGKLNQLSFSGNQRRELIRLLGEIRPKRLLDNLKLDLGMVDLRKKILLQKKEFVGIRKLIALRTSTGTFIANGFATHNSPANILGTGELGVVVRLWDKIARLMNLTGFVLKVEPAVYDKPKTPKNESVDDAYMDLSVYGIIGQLLRKGKWGN